MSLRRHVSGLVAVLGCLTLIGCQQPGGMAQGDDMEPPPRAAELDQLNEFVGSWKGTGKMTMHEGPEGPQEMDTSGTETVTWTCDNRVLMSQMEWEMPEMGKIEGLWLATWDSGDKKFRTWWFDNMGGIGEGTMWKDAESGQWVMKSTGRNGMTGETTRGTGWSKMTDANTIEWSFTEYDSWGITKKMSGSGTNKKM